MKTYIFVITSLFAVCYGQLQGPSGHLGINSFTVAISVTSEQGCQVPHPLPGITVTVPPGASALNALETAAQLNHPFYSFTVQYKRNFGYIIDSFSGVSATSSCRWVLSAKPQGQSQPTRYTQRGINFYQIPVSNTAIIFSYVPTSMYQFMYQMSYYKSDSNPNNQYTESNSYSISEYSVQMNSVKGTTECPVSGNLPKKFSITIEIGQSLQNALERAADRCARYEFRAYYEGPADTGYLITGIGSIPIIGNCVFCASYKEPQSGFEYSTKFVTNYVIPVNGGSVQFLYTRQTGVDVHNG